MNAPKAKQTVTPWHINRATLIGRVDEETLHMVASNEGDPAATQLCKLELARREALEA